LPRDLNRIVTRPRHTAERLAAVAEAILPRTLNRKGRRRSRLGDTLDVTAGTARVGCLGALVVKVLSLPILVPPAFLATTL
jgi:hypothetical protein